MNGEAKRVQAHLPTTEANYDVALKLFQDRYDNQFLITKAHLSNIFKIDPMKKECPESLRKLIGVFNENEMALNALGLGTKASDFMWIHILAGKLDSETAKEWQLTNVDGKLQSMNALRKFLELRARALEASGRTLEQKREPMKENGKEKPDDACQSFQSISVSSRHGVLSVNNRTEYMSIRKS